MALSRLIPRADLDRVAPVLGKGLARFLSLDGRRTELGEAFDVWALGVVEPTGASTLEERAVSTGRTYVQVYAAGGERPAEPLAVASIAGVGTPQVRFAGLFQAWLAHALNAAIDEVDRSRRVSDEVIARLLVASPYRLHALWFPGPEDELYVVSTLRDLEKIRRGQWIRGREMLDALATEPFIRGVVD